MKSTCSPLLKSFLLAHEGWGRADLISVAISNGLVIRSVYGTNVDIAYGGNTFYSSKYGAWERGPFANSAEYRPSANSMDVTALFQQDALFPGTSSTMMQAVAAGAFNGAVVTIQTAYWPTTVPDWSSQAAYFPGRWSLIRASGGSPCSPASTSPRRRRRIGSSSAPSRPMRRPPGPPTASSA